MRKASLEVRPGNPVAMKALADDPGKYRPGPGGTTTCRRAARTIDLRRRFFCAPPPLNLSAVDRRARTSALPGHEAAIGLPVRVA